MAVWRAYGGQLLGFLLLGSSLMLLSCDGTNASRELPKQDRVTDETAIRALFVALEMAANQRNAAGTEAQYARDGDIWVAGGPWVKGAGRCC